MSDATLYLVVENWGDHLHPDQRRKAKPPYRWVKLQTEALDTQGDMTLREYGAYCRLLMLAGLTDNVTVYRPNWIRRRTGITQKDVEKLKKRGLISIRNELPDFQKTEENQSTNSQTASGDSDSCQEGAAPDRNRNRLDRNRRREPSSESKTFSSFDDIKREVLAAAQRLMTRNGDYVYRQSKDHLKACKTRRQFDAAWQQLEQDGDLPTGRSTEDYADEYRLHRHSGESDDDFRKRVLNEQLRREKPELFSGRAQ